LRSGDADDLGSSAVVGPTDDSGVSDFAAEPAGRVAKRATAAEREARTQKVMELELQYDTRLTALLSAKKFDSVLVRASTTVACS